MQPRRKAILIALSISILLMLAKFVAFFLTGSNAILTDAAESIVNVIAGCFAFYSIYLSTQPRDENHPYGHGKVEFFSAFIEGVLIFIAGLVIIVASIYGFLNPQPIEKLGIGTIILSFSGLVNLVTGLYLVRKGRELHSMTLQADGKHLLTDTFTSAAVVAGLIVIVLTGEFWLDNVISAVAGSYIIVSGYKIVRRSVGGLMDESDDDTVREIVNILQQNRQDAWIDVHNLRAQQYGPDLHIDCHVTLPYYFD
ncbi:MAG: cation transporter, partial [Chitinophagaceae bacterium]